MSLVKYLELQKYCLREYVEKSIELSRNRQRMNGEVVERTYEQRIIRNWLIIVWEGLKFAEALPSVIGFGRSLIHVGLINDNRVQLCCMQFPTAINSDTNYSPRSFAWYREWLIVWIFQKFIERWKIVLKLIIGNLRL